VNTRRWSIAGVLLVLILAGALRGLWLTADPASGTATNAGVVWHDEGAWVHNARNQALWGVWRTDEWNPMYIAPVFTGLESAAFHTFGVGTWQARTVPLASGLIAIVALMWGLWGVGGRNAALIGGLLLATNYTFVMWNRAALMESTMTMFIVVGWAAYARSFDRPRWGLLAGAAVVLAFFTKAAAAFFVGAMVLELATTWWTLGSGCRVQGSGFRVQGAGFRVQGSRFIGLGSAGFWTVVGLAVAGLLALLVFVLPNWTEFQFYNWAMTVERKPEYTLAAFSQNASWLPLTHGVFMRMWAVVLIAGIGVVGVIARWRSAHPAERLAVLWLFVGLLEVVIHDSGNQRRYVMFVPALIALASLRLAPERAEHAGSQDPASADSPAFTRLASAFATAVLGYLTVGSVLRFVWLDENLAGHYRMTVRVSAVLATALAAIVWWKWREWRHSLAQVPLPRKAAIAIVAITCVTDLTLYARWSAERTYLNYDASRMLNTLLPPRTLVHGKLANGLALENQIAPLFVGNHFGNYDDRLKRDDARYILTYTLPKLGNEGPIILDVLNHYPGKRTIAEFDVAASEIDLTAGFDRAALIDKFPDRPESSARHQ
jgi:hypothetical protein